MKYKKYLKNLGAIPSPEDKRDFVYSAAMPTDGKELIPDEFVIPYRQTCVYNQKTTPMCVAFAAKRIMEQLEAKEHSQYTPMSAGFIYKNRYSGDLMYMFDSAGMITREAVRHLQVEGVCASSIYDWMGNWQNLSMEEKRKPLNDTLYDFAYYKALEYIQLNTDEEMMRFMLENKTGILFVIPVTSKFKGGINEQITLEWAKANNQGYHAMVIEGWKTINGQKYWYFTNSWGSWYTTGDGYLPFGYPITEKWAIIGADNKPSYYHVQIGAFSEPENAKALRDNLVRWGYSTYMVSVYNEQYKKVLHKVQVGAYYYRKNADDMKKKIESDERIKALGVGTWILKY